MNCDDTTLHAGSVRGSHMAWHIGSRMRRLQTVCWALALGVACASVMAQAADGTSPGVGPGGGRAGPEYTPGWSQMSAQERNAHREHMRAMTSYGECRAYIAQHHAEMHERAKAQGMRPWPRPRRDACAGLKP